MPKRESAIERQDIRKAQKLLEDTGLTLTDAARLALTVLPRKSSNSPTFEEAFEPFIRHCMRKRLKSATLSYYENCLSRINEAYGDRKLSEVSRSDWKTYLEQSELSPGNAKARLRTARALYSWALNENPPLVETNPLMGLKLNIRPQRHEIEFLTVADTKKIMENAGKHSAAFALMLFAGIRPEEISARSNQDRLLWENIQFDEKIIRIPGSVSKTGKPRLLEHLPENLWSWLSEGKSGPISSVSSTAVTNAAQFAGGFLKREGDKKQVRIRPWPFDGMRHSFATYHIALHGDPGRTSLILGHEGKTTLLHNNYRGLATKAEAERYFGTLI